MCIIAAKAAGIPMPNRERIKTMWDGNRDGAGLMYVENGQVRIEKGFMKYKDFTKVLDRLEKRLDLTATPVVMHFRITTHGGTKPENCHPFPITDNVGALKKLTITTDLGVAHNGIIPISPRKGISDTSLPSSHRSKKRYHAFMRTSTLCCSSRTQSRARWPSLRRKASSTPSATSS